MHESDKELIIYRMPPSLLLKGRGRGWVKV